LKFEWDEKKEAINVAKHGVNFTEACRAFVDSRRLIAVDEAHSEEEARMFCVGRTDRGEIVTVRFTIRGDRIRIIGAGYWRTGKRLYEKENG
jgi:uncharacterized DUF497 family protein